MAILHEMKYIIRAYCGIFGDTEENHGKPAT
jgi:hypothetical protein